MPSWLAIKNRLPSTARDLVGIAGAASIAYGAWMVYPAAGFIVGGLLAAGGAAYLAWIESQSAGDR